MSGQFPWGKFAIYSTACKFLESCLSGWNYLAHQSTFYLLKQPPLLLCLARWTPQLHLWSHIPTTWTLFWLRNSYMSGLMNFMHGHSSSCGRRHGQPSSFRIVSQMQLSTNPKIYCHGGPWAGYIYVYPLLFAGHWYMDMNLRCHSFFVFLWAMLILRLRLPILNLRISRLTTSTLIYSLSEPTKLNGHNRISDRESVFHPTLGYEIGYNWMWSIHMRTFVVHKSKCTPYLVTWTIPTWPCSHGCRLRAYERFVIHGNYTYPSASNPPSCVRRGEARLSCLLLLHKCTIVQPSATSSLG